MTWSYDPTKLTDPVLGPLMQVRLEIGDTNTAEQQMADEEIGYVLTDVGDTLYSAARCCDMLAAKYAREADLVGGGLQMRNSQISIAYTKLGATLRDRAALSISPYAGGISQADKLTNQLNTDRVTPAFFTDMLKNPNLVNPTDAPINR